MKIYVTYLALLSCFSFFLAAGSRQSSDPSEKIRLLYPANSDQMDSVSGYAQPLVLNDSMLVSISGKQQLFFYNFRSQTVSKCSSLPVSGYEILGLQQDDCYLFVYGKIADTTLFYQLSKHLPEFPIVATYRYLQPKAPALFPLPEHGFCLRGDTLFCGMSTRGPGKLLEGSFFRRSVFNAKRNALGSPLASSIQFKALYPLAQLPVAPEALPMLHFNDNTYMSVYNTICALPSERLLFAVDSSKEIRCFRVDTSAKRLLMITQYNHNDSSGIYQLHTYSFPQIKALNAPLRIVNKQLSHFAIREQQFYLFGRDCCGDYVEIYPFASPTISQKDLAFQISK